MYEITADQVRMHLVDVSQAKELAVRRRDGSLFRMCTKHELEALALSMYQGAVAYVSGMANKHGFRYAVLNVTDALAAKRLRKIFASSGRIIADDCRTIDRSKVAGGGIAFAHRSDLKQIWQRKRHWSNWGARDRQNRAVVIVPRFEVQQGARKGAANGR